MNDEISNLELNLIEVIKKISSHNDFVLQELSLLLLEENQELFQESKEHILKIYDSSINFKNQLISLLEEELIPKKIQDNLHPDYLAKIRHDL